MTFQRVTANGHFRMLRLLSDTGRWELGLNPYSHGVRLRMGQAGLPPQVIDFCLGTDPSRFSKVLVAVLKLLEPLDEESTPQAIDAVFPWAGTRPDLTVHLSALLIEEKASACA